MAPETNSRGLIALRERLSGAGGKDYWRSLEELAGTKEFEDFVAREFPAQASEWTDPVGRRTFLKLMAASLALAGLEACAHQPPEEVVPFVRQPEEMVPGKALFFATAMTLSGVATGLLAKSVEGRPIKIEGNPEHASSLGATDILTQASLLTLYDPDRSQTVTYRGDIRSWSSFLVDIQVTLERLRIKQGAGLYFLTETITSPTVAEQLNAIRSDLGQAQWHQYDPANRDYARAGALLALGNDVETVYAVDKADRIISLGSDFLSCGRGHLKYIRDFSARRRVAQPGDSMNRLYVVECTPSNTGAKADHRLSVRPSEMEILARVLASAVGASFPEGTGAQQPGRTTEAQAKWISAAARDLSEHSGQSVVIAGNEQPPAVHALAHAMNQRLGNVGKTVLYTSPIEANSTDQTQSLRQLTSDMDAGKVDVLAIVGGNPVYNAPADLNFAQRMGKVNLRIHLSLYEDETSDLCHWHIPEAHYLESWGDSRAYDGTVMLTQPLIAPLYYGKTAHEFLAAFSGKPEQSGYDILRNYWKKNWTRFGSGDFEHWWRKSVHDGFVTNSEFLPNPGAGTQVNAGKSSPPPGRAAGAFEQQQPMAPSPGLPGQAGSLEILFRTDPAVYDGRFANNGWLQELPKPLTKLTWDNAAMVSPKTAERLGFSMSAGVEGGNYSVDVVELGYRGRTVQAPIWILPGQPDDSVTVHLGYGRSRAGRVGTAAGFNAFAIRTSDSPWFATGLSIRKTRMRHRVSCTQLHHTMENRDPVRSATLEEYRRHPDFVRGHAGDSEDSPSLYPRHEYKGYAWGMAIDTTACVGCSACVVACQAENNIPVVGKEQVGRSREMHWIRVDRYYQGSSDDPRTYFQPVPCMHCENAPCEPVCPVGATVHSAEGLNEMVYNRCVGTRYCSNNCPYKVRRFNFLLYSDWNTPSLKLARNPEVTVRSRGVMEKCTYCVQRINAARIEAEKENRSIRDGEIVTACQASCPAEAIVFGNIKDPNSRVAKLKAQPRNYSLLADLNTQPRTTYLAVVRNPNPELEKS
jgi:molybdopterin-containing oxidoreductase family iron-sulfur binding subunit